MQSPTPASRLLRHISDQLGAIAAVLDTAVENDAKGIYRPPQGYLEYPIMDVDGQPLETEWSDPDHVTEQDIRDTAGFKQLVQRSNSMRLSLDLRTKQSVAYPDEDRNNYTIVISGWSG